ncbi:putative Hippurate hydrolase [Glarea lozoyensis 74030]|uniref:Putative Hippurate hydrolase n=1 Tax=Glarea lozoyensis (strain ATCC 74030 / MF5533) TaxID=1104152 RepID=H0ENX4_GLAL7|nr:putative Hippurate hydrolase [Glarea lozoyensis 74030]
MTITSIISDSKPDLQPYEELYKELHQNPGLSLQEHFAAETAAKYLRELDGFEVRTNIGGTGLIGILKNGEGKTVLLRADIDALPVEELTGLPYASKKKEVDVEDGNEYSVMHAFAAAFAKHFGDQHDSESPPLGGSEDFSILATEAPNKNGGKGVPYTYWNFGGVDPKKYKDALEKGTMSDIPINHTYVEYGR